MARLIDVPGSAGPLNEGERRVVKALLDGLRDGYWVAANVELAERQGQSFDYDCIVVTPHAVYVVGSRTGAGRSWATSANGW